MAYVGDQSIYRWRRPRVLPKRTWRVAMRDCDRVVGWLAQHKGTVVKFDRDEPGPPEFGEEMVMFNGPGADGADLFCVEQAIERREDLPPHRGPHFESCDTGGKPYGLAVCCCLIVLDHHFGRFVVLNTVMEGDGHWLDALEVCQVVLGYGKDVRLSPPPEQFG
jgi:hypothetical protein